VDFLEGAVLDQGDLLLVHAHDLRHVLVAELGVEQHVHDLQVAEVPRFLDPVHVRAQRSAKDRANPLVLLIPAHVEAGGPGGRREALGAR
jgi:hypothetical protein